MSARERHRDRRARAHQILRRQKGRRQFHAAGGARSHPGLSRPERQRQDDDDPHALRPADARFGRGRMSWLRHSPAAGRDQALCRLHDAGLFALSRPHHSRKSGVRRARLRSRSAGGRGSERRWSAWGSSRAPTNSPANCPAAGNSDWRLAHASCLARRCSSSTNRPRASIPRRDATSGTRSIIWRRKA